MAPGLLMDASAIMAPWPSLEVVADCRSRLQGSSCDSAAKSHGNMWQQPSVCDMFGQEQKFPEQRQDQEAAAKQPPAKPHAHFARRNLPEIHATQQEAT